MSQSRQQQQLGGQSSGYGQSPGQPAGQRGRPIQPQQGYGDSDQYGQAAGNDQYGQAAGNDQYGQAAGNDKYGQAAGNDPYGQAAGNDPYGQAAGDDQYGPDGGAEQHGDGEEGQLGEEQDGQENQTQDGQGASNKRDNAVARTPGAKGSIAPSGAGPKHSKFPQDPHHSKLMAHYHEMTETGMTEDHIHSIIHVGSLFLAHLARSSGMTAGHHADHETAKAAHQGGRGN